MIRKMIALAVAGAVLVSGALPVAAQDGPKVFTRSGQWQLDAAEEDCRIARVFVNGDQQIALALERDRADPMVRLVLVTNALTTYRTTEELGYKLGAEGEQRSARYIQAEMADGQTYYNLGNVLFAAPPAPGTPPPAPGTAMPPYDRAAEQAFAAGVTSIEINQGLTQPVRLDTGSLRAAITALQACQDDLLQVWGLDYAAHQTMTRRAAPDGRASDWIPAGTVGFGDFPLFAGGRNPFRVMVSAEGQPTACSAMWVSLDASKNERICHAIMEHGRFLPALDAAGQPMASYWVVDYMFGLAPPPPGR